MVKLVVVVMGQNCEKFIEMCLESVKQADAIIYCDGGSTDKTLNIVRDFLSIHQKGYDYTIKQSYNQEDLGMNGKQRNFYLDYVKKNYPGWYCLVLDADEVLDEGGIQKIKEFLDKNGD